MLETILSRFPASRIVGDAMVGSGTTALAAISRGHDAFVADWDPLSCLLTRAKTHPVDPADLRALVDNILDEVGSLGYRARSSRGPSEWIDKMESETPFRAPENTYHWFHPTVARDLARILLVVHERFGSRQTRLRDSVLSIVAATIRRVSRADPKPVSGLEVTKIRKAALNHGLRFDLRAQLLGRAEVLAQGYRELLELPELGQATVVRSDARNWAQACGRRNVFPSIQVTSPPYLCAIDYWRRHRLEHSWLGLVPTTGQPSQARRSIGACRPLHHSDGMDDSGLPDEVLAALGHFMSSSQSAKARTVREYALGLNEWVEEVAQVAYHAEPTGEVFVVAGPSGIAGVSLPIPQIICQMAEKAGLHLVQRSRHKIVNQRMQYTLRQGYRIREESILRFAA